MTFDKEEITRRYIVLDTVLQKNGQEKAVEHALDALLELADITLALQKYTKENVIAAHKKRFESERCSSKTRYMPCSNIF
jgi:hypothetical protein